MTTTFSDGRKLPFLVESHLVTKLNNGSETKTLSEQYAVANSSLQAWLDALPKYKDGLELQNVSPQRQGAFSLVTVEYVTPGSNSQEGALVWWSSTGEGLVYHEQRYIALSASRSVSEAAISARFGLKPNGCSVNPQSDGIHAVADSTWGPAEAEEADDDAGQGGEDSGEEGDTPEQQAEDTGLTMARSPGTLTLTGDLALQYRLGKANLELLNEISDWKKYAAALKTGALIYAPLPSFSGGGDTPVWQWASGSALPNQPAPQIPAGFEKLLEYGSEALSAGAISVPIPIFTTDVVSKMKIVAKSGEQVLGKVMSTWTGKDKTTIPAAPEHDVGNGIKVRYTWEKAGISTSGGITRSRKYKKYGAASGGSLYVNEYTVTYTTSYTTQPEPYSET